MTVAIGVVAHKDRADQAHALQEQVGAQYLHMDTGLYGCDESHRRTWTYLADTNSEWSVVLEDDAEPISEFRTQLDLALAAAPTDVVSLYLGTSRPEWMEFSGRGSAVKVQPLLRDAVAQASVTGASFITCTRILHGVALCIRTTLVPSMLDFTRDSKQPFDYAIGDWCYNEDHRVAYTQPSLVDHQDGPTLFKHPDGQPRTHPRKAYRLGGRQHWHGDKVVAL